MCGLILCELLHISKLCDEENEEHSPTTTTHPFKSTHGTYRASGDVSTGFSVSVTPTDIAVDLPVLTTNTDRTPWTKDWSSVSSLTSAVQFASVSPRGLTCWITTLNETGASQNPLGSLDQVYWGVWIKLIFCRPFWWLLHKNFSHMINNLDS